LIRPVFEPESLPIESTGASAAVIRASISAMRSAGLA